MAGGRRVEAWACVDMLDGRPRRRPDRVGAVAPAAGRARAAESTGVHRLPGGIDRGGRGARLPGGRPLDRRGLPLRRFDRAVALRPRDAGDARRWSRGRPRTGRTPSVERGRPSPTRAAGAAPRWRAGRSATWRFARRPRRARRATLTARWPFGRRPSRSSSSCRRCGASPRPRCWPATRSAPWRSVDDAFARSVAVDERVLLDAVRRHRRPRRAGRRTAGRGCRLARRLRGAARSDPGRRRRRARPRPRPRRARSGATGVARTALEAAVEGWDRRRPNVGGHLGAARPGRLPVRSNRFADARRRGERGPSCRPSASSQPVARRPGRRPPAHGPRARHRSTTRGAR